MPYKKVQIICKNCGKKIYTANRFFCDNNCRLKFQVGKNSPCWKGKEWICQFCGKKILGIPSVKRRFCSWSCNTSYQNIQRGKFNKIWNKEILHNLYWKNNMTMSEIARKYNTSASVVFRYFKKWDIEKRPFIESVSIGIQKNIKKWIGKGSGKKNSMYGKISYPKAVYVPKLEHHIRSKWEKDVAFILKNNEIPYKFEGIRFKVNKGNNTYSPDFVIGNLLVEVKGPLFESNKEKMIECIKLYPNFKLIIITSRSKRFDFSFAHKIFRIFKSARKEKGYYDVDNDEVDKFIKFVKSYGRSSNIEG